MSVVYLFEKIAQKKGGSYPKKLFNDENAKLKIEMTMFRLTDVL